MYKFTLFFILIGCVTTLSENMTDQELKDWSEKECNSVPELDMERVYCQIGQIIHYCLENPNNKSEMCIESGKLKKNENSSNK